MWNSSIRNNMSIRKTYIFTNHQTSHWSNAHNDPNERQLITNLWGHPKMSDSKEEMVPRIKRPLMVV
jgi:hypothetical protein